MRGGPGVQPDAAEHASGSIEGKRQRPWALVGGLFSDKYSQQATRRLAAAGRNHMRRAKKNRARAVRGAFASSTFD